MAVGSLLSTSTEWVSPLREIELAVQERAKAASLDMGAAGAADRLRELLVEEVASWREDYQRGRRSFDIADPDAAVERALRNLAGYGPLEPLLEDPDVWEIMVRPFGATCNRKVAGQSVVRVTVGAR